jgi:hypothetical protein
MQQSINSDLCPVCSRPLGNSNVSRHHWVPKSRGGKIQEWVHDICHDKIHSVFTNAELDHEYSDPIAVQQHPEMVKFIKWVKTKPPEFYDSSRQTTARRGKGKYR